MITDQQLVDRGTEAEAFKRYLTENQYFLSVVAFAKLIIQQNISTLRPDEQMRFTILRANAEGIDGMMSLIDMDIKSGQEALGRMQGGTREQGTYGEGDVL